VQSSDEKTHQERKKHKMGTKDGNEEERNLKGKIADEGETTGATSQIETKTKKGNDKASEVEKENGS